ncbi:MAG TPA: polysaccharide biosynthesis C-terminal domain-containing protein [Kofleriaceae bacterium]|nr:polysaccharide biosynthesis C-terminal domain-containing protein [Kofleriaceae bacterium]
MNERARLRRDVAWNVVPVALLGVVGLGLNFVIIGWWSTEALGVFNLVTIALFVTAVVGAFGLQYAVLHAVAAAGGQAAAPIVVGALVPGVVIAAAATGAFLALRGAIARLLGDDVAAGMLWAAPAVFCFSINKILFGVVNGLRRMRAFALYTSLRYVLIAVGVVLARAWRVEPDHLAVIWTLSEGTLLVVLAIELAATVALARGAGWRAWARRHLDYGGRGLTATLAYEINTKLDVWMLGAAGIAKELVGVYSVAAAINEGATQLAVALQNNLNPMIARELAGGRPGEVEALVRRTRRWFVPGFALACALGAGLFPRVIPAVLHDPHLALGGLPFAILMAGLVAASPYLPFNQVLLMAERPGWHTALLVCVVAVNFAGDLALIPRLDLVGAAIATSSAAVCAALLVRRLARTRAGVRL